MLSKKRSEQSWFCPQNKQKMLKSQIFCLVVPSCTTHNRKPDSGKRPVGLSQAQ